MKPLPFRFITGFLLFFFLMGWVNPWPARSDFLYKSYLVRQDMGWDILCDPHIVQKNESLRKLFKQKGEIAYRNFQEFLSIFRHLNPHISNIDQIPPGEHIFIPIKKLAPGTLPGQASGLVTIPFVTITNLAEIIESHSTAYEVRKGDAISRLIDRQFRGHGKKSYREGTQLFRLINPDIVDPNRIYPGQIIRLPAPSIQNEPWYDSLFDRKGHLMSMAKLGKFSPVAGRVRKSSTPRRSVSPLDETARLLKATLFNRGTYFFPRPGRDDLELDIAEVPFLSLKDGTRILLPKATAGNLSEKDLAVIRSFWKRVKIVAAPPKLTVEELLDAVSEALSIFSPNTRIFFSDSGIKVEVRAKWLIIEQAPSGGKLPPRVCITPIDRIEERIHPSVKRYLEQHNIIIKEIIRGVSPEPPKPIRQKNKKRPHGLTTLRFSDPKILVRDLSLVLGYTFSEKITLSFPYAGLQIETLSNLIAKPNGLPLLVDFGDLQGDAVRAIKKTGLDIIQINREDPLRKTLTGLLRALGVAYTTDPDFLAANRPKIYNVSFTLPGFLVKNAKMSKIFLTDSQLPDELIQFIRDQNIGIIRMHFEKPLNSQGA